MPTKGEGAIGALDYTTEERQELAKKSRAWKCPKCGSCNATVLPPEPEAAAPPVESTPSPQPERTTTPTTSTSTNVTNNNVQPVTTTSTANNNNNTIQNNNNNNMRHQPMNPNRFQANQFQANMFQANQYGFQNPQYPVNQQINQYQQANPMYQQMNYANVPQRPPVSDAVRRQQAFLDLVILSLFLTIVALIVNKLTKEADT